MKGKTTGELLEELMETGNFGSYLSRNREQMICPDVGQTLNRMCRQQPHSKAAVARRSGVSEVYFHQVLSGKRSPSRDRIISLCIGLSATVEQTQDLLRQAGFARLDPRMVRDALILHGMAQGQTLPQINGALLVRGEKAL